MTDKEEEWEINITVFIKNEEEAKAALCDVYASILNYPITYIDTKLSKVGNREVLKSLEDIEH